MSLDIGTRIGSYELIALIGVGATGEVYRARDTTLNRHVALKVLAESLVSDTGRLARFRHEAAVLASLNHPNVAHIYGVEESRGTVAIVLELVEGPTLADRVVDGPIAPDEAVRFATQVCRALEAAHAQGIVHRDLKPANIKVRPDGIVKVLDFGLAKATSPPWMAPHGSQSPTLTMASGPGAGTILGSVAYMSPEQARGQPVDGRTDIWALGCVLYEMLTGSRAFDAGAWSDTLASVLRNEPAWDALPPGLSPVVAAYLRRCLQKDPGQRIHDVADLRLALEGAFDVPHPPHDAVRSGRGWLPGRWIAAATLAALLVGVVLGGALFQGSTAPPPGDVYRLAIPLDAGQHLADGDVPETDATLQRPTRRSFVLTPDGRRLVYVASSGTGTRLYVRRLDQLQALPVPGTEGASSPFIAPDGSSVGFFAGGKLKRVALATGEVRTLATSGSEYLATGASWTANDTMLLSAPGGIYEVPSDGGRLNRLVPRDDRDGTFLYPELLPGGRAVLFNETTGTDPMNAAVSRPGDWNIVVASLDTNDRRVIVEGGSDPRFVESGHILFVRAGTLMAVPFDVQRLEATGDPVAVLEDVMHADGGTLGGVNSGAGQLSVSRAGSLAYAPGGTFPIREYALHWVGRTGDMTPLALPSRPYVAPGLSPDGTRLAYSDQHQIWVYDIEQEVSQRLGVPGLVSVWSPDGTRLAVGPSDEGQVYVMAADGSGRPEPLFERSWIADRAFPGSWSRDDVLAVVRAGDIWTISVGDTGTPVPFVEGAAAEAWPSFSADGKWLAYASNETGRFEVYVRPFPDGAPVVRVSTQGGRAPVWSPDQSQLFFRAPGDWPASGGAVMVVDITTEPTFRRRGRPRVLFQHDAFRRATAPFRSYDVDPDGHRFVMADGALLNQPRPVASLNVVLNWFNDLERLAPASQ